MNFRDEAVLNADQSAGRFNIKLDRDNFTRVSHDAVQDVTLLIQVKYCVCSVAGGAEHTAAYV